MNRLADEIEGFLAPRDEVMVVAYGGLIEVLLPMTPKIS